MRKRPRLALHALLAAGALALALAAAGCGDSEPGEPFKAAWVYVGPHDDDGWSQAHDEGRRHVQQALGDKVRTTYRENVAVGEEFSRTVAGLAEQGYELIFATSYGYVTRDLAAQHPTVLFEQATGTLVTKNVSEYFGRSEDTIFLSGMAAGAASRTGRLGFVVAFPIPEVIRHTNAFALGAQRTHPGATVRIAWTHSWFDPAAERKAARSLHAAGVDVLGQNVDSPATGRFAESAGIPWVGYDHDASRFAPKSWLTASVYDWGPYYLRRVREAIAGTWKPGFYYGSIKDGFTRLAPFGPSVSSETKAEIARMTTRLADGSFYEFEGPLHDQQGRLRVPKGERMTVEQLYSMDWLVKGVIGSAKG